MKENISTCALPTTYLVTNESTSVLLETFTLHHEGKLAHARFPYSTSTSALPKTTLHCEANLTHASIPFIMKESSRTCPTHE